MWITLKHICSSATLHLTELLTLWVHLKAVFFSLYADVSSFEGSTVTEFTALFDVLEVEWEGSKLGSVWWRLKKERKCSHNFCLLFLKQSALVVAAMEATAMNGRSASVRMGFTAFTVRKVTIFLYTHHKDIKKWKQSYWCTNYYVVSCTQCSSLKMHCKLNIWKYNKQ